MGGLPFPVVNGFWAFLALLPKRVLQESSDTLAEVDRNVVLMPQDAGRWVGGAQGFVLGVPLQALQGFYAMKPSMMGSIYGVFPV